MMCLAGILDILLQRGERTLRGREVARAQGLPQCLQRTLDAALAVLSVRHGVKILLECRKRALRGGGELRLRLFQVSPPKA